MMSSIFLKSKETLPYYRSPNGVALLIRYMEAQGFKPEIILEGSGLSINNLDDPDYALTIEQELHVIRKVVKLSPDPMAGFVLGKQYHLGVLSKVAPAAISCDTLIEAIKVLFHYSFLTLTFFQLELTVKESHAFITLKDIIDLQEARKIIIERDLVSIYRIASDLIGYPFPLIQIRIAYRKPVYANVYEEVFKCPVMFNAEHNVMTFDSSLLFKQLPMSNSLTKKIYEQKCKEHINNLKSNETLSEKLTSIFIMNKDRIPDLNQLSKIVNMSERTLRRRLIDEGTSYKKLSADLKQKKAIDLLTSTSYSIEQISLILGYGDLPSFNRAFKSWTGLNPGYYRKNIIHGKNK